MLESLAKNRYRHGTTHSGFVFSSTKTAKQYAENTLAIAQSHHHQRLEQL